MSVVTTYYKSRTGDLIKKLDVPEINGADSYFLNGSNCSVSSYQRKDRNLIVGCKKISKKQYIELLKTKINDVRKGN